MNDINAIEVHGLSKCFSLRRKKGPDFLSLQRFDAVRDIARGRLQENRFKDQLWALREIDLYVRQGEILGIIGRNGAGKSTLLKILARVLRPTAGSATIRGQVASLLEMGVGFDRELTVRENILMYSVMNNIPEKKVLTQIKAIAEFANLEEQLDVPLSNCPGGAFIRLAFAAAINVDADVVLADEVLAVGDSEFQAECLGRIREDSKIGKAILFVSHNMDQIENLCHRVIWLDRGQILMEGDPDDVVDEYHKALLGETRQKPQSTLPLSTEIASSLEGTIQDIRIINTSGAEISVVDMGSEAAIDIWVQTAANVESFSIQLACRLAKSQSLVFSVSQPCYNVSAGHRRHRVCLHLPKHFFNESTYQFRAILELKGDGKNRIIETEKVASLSVYDVDPTESSWGDWPFGRGGFICPRLDWEYQISRPTNLSNN